MLNVTSSIQVTLRGYARVLYDDGTEDEISFPPNAFAALIASGNIASSDTVVPPSGPGNPFVKPGWVVAAVVVLDTISGNTMPERGQTYVQMFIAGTAVAPASGVALTAANLSPAFITARQIILSDYLYALNNPTLGDVVPPGPAGGPGVIRTILLGDPAANAEYPDQTPGVGGIWKLRGFNGTLVTDANAANRLFRISVLANALNIGGGGIAGNIQTATLTQIYLGAPGSPVPPGGAPAAGLAIPIPLPDIPIVGGAVAGVAAIVRFTTTNLQATDNWGSGFLIVEEWVAP